MARKIRWLLAMVIRHTVSPLHGARSAVRACLFALSSILSVYRLVIKWSADQTRWARPNLTVVRAGLADYGLTEFSMPEREGDVLRAMFVLFDEVRSWALEPVLPACKRWRG